MSLNLVALKEPNLKLLYLRSMMLDKKLHTQLPLNRHMNGGGKAFMSIKTKNLISILIKVT